MIIHELVHVEQRAVAAEYIVIVGEDELSVRSKRSAISLKSVLRDSWKAIGMVAEYILVIRIG